MLKKLIRWINRDKIRREKFIAKFDAIPFSPCTGLCRHFYVFACSHGTEKEEVIETTLEQLLKEYKPIGASVIRYWWGTPPIGCTRREEVLAEIRQTILDKKLYKEWYTWQH